METNKTFILTVTPQTLLQEVLNIGVPSHDMSLTVRLAQAGVSHQGPSQAMCQAVSSFRSSTF